MTRLKRISMLAAVPVALSIMAACAQNDDLEQAQSIQIADPYGEPRSVTVLATRNDATESYIEVRMGGRDFMLAQWTDAGFGRTHNVVASLDGELRYDHIADPAGARIELTDASGTRVVSAGEALGRFDEDAATLLMSLRAAPGTDVAYSYQTYCVWYDTSNSSDWHLTFGSCTCEHWYSMICSMN